jgi:ABC-2 type transport system ATP-binding protein
MTKALKLHKLNKTYKTKTGNLKALNDISLTIEKGSFFGLLGPNGAGKSTIINILADLVTKDSGTINIMGYDFDKNKINAKNCLGIVPQELVMDPFFNVKETLEIYAGYYGIKKANRRTDEIIRALGLTDKATAKPRSLSGGMKRRLLVGKSLVHNPDIIILDEPTAGVDVELRDQLWEYISKLNKQGKTIILTTHYLEEAEELCDQIAIINKGKIIANDQKSNLKKIFGVKTLNITLKNPKEEIRCDLQEFGDITINNNIISIKYKTNNLEYDKLINKLTKNNAEIIDLNTQETDIEDIFKNLVYQK